MARRAQDWMSQAERDLAQAEISRGSDIHEWACFAAHQAAEKAVKALHLHLGQEAWGHVAARLLRELPKGTRVAEELVEKAKVLDTYYVASRYPNAHAEGPPSEHYGPLQSEQAVRYAREIVEFVRSQMA